MGKVILDMTVSINGCVAGANDEPGGLHDWFFIPSEVNQAVIEEQIKSTGALVMGRRTYDMGASQDGFAENPFQVDHFIVSHSEPDSRPKGDTSFTFVSTGVPDAVRLARAAAGERNVVVGGGASIAQQCLAADLVDEIRLAVRPVVLTGGIPLFGGGAGMIELERLAVVDTPEVTHFRFAVAR
ncbi:dihydrofolate reductase family protein [Micromonospora sp. LOL_013]|uniref:dihydrofolate reductase family protein n=1 Tax=Micromonospora sp. LOL_013 TaxID=3345414 RepID=UPI003A8A485F